MNLITPERVPVSVYRWDDANAPVLDRKANCVASIFKACLVTGYGSKQPAGWSMPYEDMTTNVKVIKPPVSTEKDYLMRLSADTGRAITVQMYANMTDINTGTLLLQLASPYRYNGGSTATGKWVMIASSRGFWFFTEVQDYNRQYPAQKQGSYLYIGDTCSNANGVKNSALTHTGGSSTYSAETYFAMFDLQENTERNLYGKVYDYTLNKALTTTKKSMFDGMTNLSNNIYLSQLTLYANSDFYDFYALPAFMPSNTNANNYDIVNAGLRFINHSTGTARNNAIMAFGCYIPIDHWEM